VADRQSRELPNGAVVHTVMSDVGDGDLAVHGEAAALAERRRRLCPHPWTWLRQVHGDGLVVVSVPAQHAGETADASVTAVPDAALAVQVADCAPVLLWAPVAGGGGQGDGPGAVVAAVHAGWKGLEAGVVARAVEAMRTLGAGAIDWTLGPCISPAAYEFGAADLDRLAARLGPAVRGATEDGHPALDLGAAVAGALAATGVTAPPCGPPPACTATSGRHFSHRGRGESARQVGVIWWDRP